VTAVEGRLLVLHGFNSAGENQKAQFLRRHLAGWEVLAPSYSHDPRLAGPELAATVERDLLDQPRAALLGTSLGAYFARYLGQRYRLPAVLINPVLDAVKTLASAVGEQRNFRTGVRYRFTAQHLAALADYRAEKRAGERLLVLLDLGDELLDSTATAQHFSDGGGVRVVCYEGGEHRFAHLGEALIEIRRFMQQLNPV
jgi:predicted esterase YcpF (UPF0227 family)